ncbi:hypothetical protein MTO96_022436 [Rhipicephalus appendiculatus]
MEDLKAAMAAHSSLHSVDTNAILQVHNKTFNTFVNIDENTTLDDNSVIRVLDVCIHADGNAVDVDAYLSGTEEEYEEKKKGYYKKYAALAKTSATRSEAAKRSPLRVKEPVLLPPATLPLLQPLSADASCDDTSENAADILESIVRGTDATATPNRLDETTTIATSNNEQQATSTNADDRPDTEAAAEVAPRRRRSRAAATADHEFVENRWRHERALKEKEYALEMEHLAVEKLRIERKQQRYDKRHELKREMTERELQLRERDMDIRERQLQAQVDEASQREQLTRFQNATQDAILKNCRKGL